MYEYGVIVNSHTLQLKNMQRTEDKIAIIAVYLHDKKHYKKSLKSLRLPSDKMFERKSETQESNLKSLN